MTSRRRRRAHAMRWQRYLDHYPSHFTGYGLHRGPLHDRQRRAIKFMRAQRWARGQ